jgi:hypothetical protein
MVFGLFVATTLTLFIVPVLFRSFIRLRDHRVRNALLHIMRLGGAASQKGIDS